MEAKYQQRGSHTQKEWPENPDSSYSKKWDGQGWKNRQDGGRYICFAVGCHDEAGGRAIQALEIGRAVLRSQRSWRNEIGLERRLGQGGESNLVCQTWRRQWAGMPCVKKRSNKVNNAIHYSENYPGLSLGVECVSGRLALKKLPCANINKKAKM